MSYVIASKSFGILNLLAHIQVHVRYALRLANRVPLVLTIRVHITGLIKNKEAAKYLKQESR